MDLPLTSPRRTWLERFSITLAIALVVVGLMTLVGWGLRYEPQLQPFAGRAPIRVNAAISFVLLGVVLVSLEFRRRRVAWLALIPVAIGAATLAETVFKLNFQIDEILLRDHLAIDTDSPGRMAPLTALCVLLAGGTLAWQAIGGSVRARRFTEAMTGSAVIAVGFSTLLGYASRLPAAYFWGTQTAVPPAAAIALFLLGLAILLIAWRESMK